MEEETRSEIQKKKLKLIKEYLQIVGAGAEINKHLAIMLNSYEPKYDREFLDRFGKRVYQKVDAELLIQKIIRIYDAHLTHKELRELIKWHNSDLGKKMYNIVPELMKEMDVAGREWANDVAAEVMEEMGVEKPIPKKIDEKAVSHMIKAEPEDSPPSIAVGEQMAIVGESVRLDDSKFWNSGPETGGHDDRGKIGFIQLVNLTRYRVKVEGGGLWACSEEELREHATLIEESDLEETKGESS